MNDFAGMEDLLSDFLLEAGEMLSEVDSKLMDLKKSPEDSKLLNEIFRGFHTIKGGAGFLNASELVALCHITENLIDKLRNRELALSAELMDVIFAATAEVRRMFGALQQGLQPSPARGQVIDALKAVLTGQKLTLPATLPSPSSAGRPGGAGNTGHDAAEWGRLYIA
jgi:two-component system chemotaxis sensor kinase CheA